MRSVAMKSCVRVIAAALVLNGVARAQTAATPATTASGRPAADRGYVEGVAQSAFGNVTTQSYGVEFGATMRPSLQVFGEFGQTRDVADTAFTNGAGAIASALARVQPAAVGVSAKRPVLFGGGGVKYRPATALTVQPYVLGGFGFARVKNNVTFTLGGAEAAAAALAPFVTLGSDLSGTSTRPLLTLGGGATWPIWQALMLDFQYRFGRIFTEEHGTTTNRAGIGFGVRF
jgi:opacity protein-like surface antigen